MADERPPRLAGDERETVLALWHYHRESFVRKVSNVGDVDARRRLVGSETTLLWLTNHLAHAERLWVEHRFAGGGEPTVGDATSIADAIAAYRQTWTVVDAIVRGAPSFDEPCAFAAHGDSKPVNLRWVVVHLLEETARHAGHADILRELIDGDTGR